MNKYFVWFVLLCAATLEAGGDALVRAGLHQAKPALRIAFLLGGAAVLFIYGCVINLPRWDFSRLIGVYIAAFFVVAQVIAWAGFGQKPTPAIVGGGALIVLGSLVISLSK